MIAERHVLLIAALVAATPVVAQSDLTPIDAVIIDAMTEQRVFVTCGALLSPLTIELFGNIWNEMAAESLAMLDADGYKSFAVTQLRDNATAQAIRMPDETPFGEIIAVCAANPEWSNQMRLLEFIDLPDAILAAAAEMP